MIQFKCVLSLSQRPNQTKNSGQQPNYSRTAWNTFNTILSMMDFFARQNTVN